MSTIKNDEGVPSKNQKLLASFSEYCLEHPEQRFWQALRNWAKVGFILKAKTFNFNEDKYEDIKDTFYLED